MNLSLGHPEMLAMPESHSLMKLLLATERMQFRCLNRQAQVRWTEEA